MFTLKLAHCYSPFYDVGQGDSIFIDTSDKDVLIDAGSATASQTVLDYLANIHIVHIDLVIATHVHEDPSADS